MQERSRILRRRLRELTDRGLALGSVHGRFAETDLPPEEGAAGEPSAATLAPVAEPAPAAVRPVITPVPPAPRPEEIHAKLLAALAGRHEDGFTVGQMKALMEELDGRVHSYDAAWALANTLHRAHVFDLAATRPGPTGPIRVFRVARVPAAVEAP